MLTTRTEILAEGVTIHMGDCREILPTLSGVDCTVTSPPYNQMEGIANRAPSGLWDSWFGQCAKSCVNSLGLEKSLARSLWLQVKPVVSSIVMLDERSVGWMARKQLSDALVCTGRARSDRQNSI